MTGSRPLLFDERVRTDRKPASHGEDSFSFLDRAEGEFWSKIRDELNAWFSAYPQDEAKDLRARFRDRRPGHHWGAWWELYLHRLFSRLGYQLTPHPKLPDTSKRPDFLVTGGRTPFLLEAVTVFSGIVDDGRDGTREGWIIDAVNRAEHPNFSVGIEFVQLGKLRPGAKRINGPLLRWLDSLDPDAPFSQDGDRSDLPVRHFTVDDWILRFEAFALRPAARGTPGRLVGVGPASGGMVDDVEQLRDSLSHKQGKYGTPDKPLVVAANCASSFMGDDDIANALYGAKALEYSTDGSRQRRWVRLRNGAWMGASKPRGRRVSAVLSAVQLHPWTAGTVVPRLWLNPWAKETFGDDLPFPRWTATDAGEVLADERTVDMADVIGVTSDWPGPEPAFPDD